MVGNSSSTAPDGSALSIAMCNLGDTVLSGSYILNNAADAISVGDFALATQDGGLHLQRARFLPLSKQLLNASIIPKPFFYFFVIIADNYSNY